jgi:hypothetical protein
MQLLHDYFYRFPPEHPRIAGRCRVRIYKSQNGTRTVLLSELSNNPGESITTACERIATDLATRWDFNPKSTHWIQHDPAHDDLPEQFDQLKFMWDNAKVASHPEWQPLEGEQVEALTGETPDALNRLLGDHEVKVQASQ